MGARFSPQATVECESTQPHFRGNRRGRRLHRYSHSPQMYCRQTDCRGTRAGRAVCIVAPTYVGHEDEHYLRRLIEGFIFPLAIQPSATSMVNRLPATRLRTQPAALDSELIQRASAIRAPPIAPRR